VSGAPANAENAGRIRRKPESIAGHPSHQSTLYHLTRWNGSAGNWHGSCEVHRVDSTRHWSATDMKILKQFLADESGATAIEYGLIAAGIALAIISAVNGLGSRLNTKFTAINTSLK
jgi:pilus assembly protein Flp/PilA